jgi:tetratricopeptide (TPR) repeat protein
MFAGKWRRRLRGVAFLLALAVVAVVETAALEQGSAAPDSPQLSRAEARPIRARADRAFNSQDYVAALELYREIYPNYADDLTVNTRLGWLYMNWVKPDYARAAFHYRKAYQLDPADIDVLHDLAKVLSWSREFDEAILRYRELVEKSPSAVRYWLELARVFVWAGQQEEAIPHYRDYLNRVPSNLGARKELGRLLAQQRDFSGAMEQYNYVLRFRPNDIDARLGLARVLGWSGELEPSLLEIEKVLESNPENFEARLLKAYDLLWLGQIDASRELFGQLTKEDPRSQDAKKGLEMIAEMEPAKPGEPPKRPMITPLKPTLFMEAEASEAQGNFDAAISLYREYLEQHPADEEAWFRLGRALGWNKQFGESQRVLGEWVDRNPSSPLGHVQLARVFRWDEKHQQALPEYRKALELEPDNVEVRIEFARILAWVKRYADALGEYGRVLEDHPTHAEAQVGMVQINMWRGEHAEARKSLAEFRQAHPDDPRGDSLDRTLVSLESQVQAAREIPAPAAEQYFRSLSDRDPTNVGARLSLADTLAGQEKFDAALVELAAAAELKPNDDDILLKTARVQSWNRSYPESARLYRDWLSRHPEDGAVKLELARVLSWDRKFNESIDTYRGLVEERPRDTDLRLELARVLSWDHRYDPALNEYETILRRDPENVDAWVGKGRAHGYQARWRPSLFAYTRALQLDPHNREARLGKAQTLLWSGRTGPARSMLGDLHSEDPADARVVVSLASAEDAAGHTDRALSLLGEVRAREPQNVDAEILRDRIRARLRPDLRITWGYGRDTERLSTWRHSVDFRFNLHPRVRHSITVDYLPSSGPITSFGYPVGGGLFAGRVPVEPFVPAPTLLGAADFPSELLLGPDHRVRQSAVQFRFGSSMRVNEWFSWSGSVGAVVLRHGSEGFTGFPKTRTELIYSVTPTFRINRQWQFSVGHAREYLAYTPKAISQTIRYDELSGSVLYTPDSLTRIALNTYLRWISPEFELPTQPGFAGGIFRQKGWGSSLRGFRSALLGEPGSFYSQLLPAARAVGPLHLEACGILDLGYLWNRRVPADPARFGCAQQLYRRIEARFPVGFSHNSEFAV